MRVSRALVLGALLAALSSCNGCRKEKTASAGTLAVLTGPNAPMAMPVPGFGDAVVSVPVGATRAMPVVVAVLGIGDTPEEQCEAWRDVVGLRAFVLCLRGAKHYVLPEEEEAGVASTAPTAPTATATATATASVPMPMPTPAPSAEPAEGEAPPTPKLAPPKMVMQVKPGAPASAEARQVGFYPVDVPSLDRELLAALNVLKQRYTIHVAEKSLVYAGFSRGAFLGASIIAKHPDLFARAVLIEGGQSAWTAESAASYAKLGASKRVLFACGQASCVEESTPAATLLKSHNADTRVVLGAGEGHGYKKQVKDQIKSNFDWIVEGDPMWAQ